MKKIFYTLLGCVGWFWLLQKMQKFQKTTSIPMSGRPIGTDIASTPYSVEKQYSKVDDIKKRQ